MSATFFFKIAWRTFVFATIRLNFSLERRAHSVFFVNPVNSVFLKGKMVYNVHNYTHLFFCVKRTQKNAFFACQYPKKGEI